jgi:carboxypeptidase family protein
MFSNALLGIILLTSTPLGQTVVTLRGQVLDELGAGLKGATVAVAGDDGSKRKVATNARGELTITNLRAENYILIVMYKGFQTYVEYGVEPASLTEPLKIIMKVATVDESREIPADGKDISGELDQNLSGIVLDEKIIQELLPETEAEMVVFLMHRSTGACIFLESLPA